MHTHDSNESKVSCVLVSIMNISSTKYYPIPNAGLLIDSLSDTDCFIDSDKAAGAGFKGITFISV